MYIKIYDITHKLLTNYTHNISLLNKFPDNGKYLMRFNPSILNISDNFFMITYRLWIDIFSEKVYSYNLVTEIGGPWYSGWTPYKNENNEIMLNIFGISIIELDESDNFKIIYDKVFKLEDNFVFLEDMRLFIDNENNIRFIANFKNTEINDYFYFNNIKNYLSDRTIGTIKIDTKDNIIKKIINPYKYLKYYNISNLNLLLTSDLLTIEKPVILFPHMHKLEIEKNWVHWKSSDNKDYITYYTFPYGTPMIHFNVIKFDKINYFDINNSLNMKNNVSCIKKYNSNIGISLIDFNSFIYEEIDFFKKINYFYFDCIKFSGGTRMIKLNDNENIGVGHLVINLNKIKNLFDNYKDFDYLSISKILNIDIKKAYNISINLKNFHNKIYNNNNHDVYAYYMYFYTINSNYPFNLLRLSDAFTPNYIKINTSVIFPCGIEIYNNDIYISYGESDNLVCILKTPLNEVNNNLMNIVDIDIFEYKFNEMNHINSYKY